MKVLAIIANFPGIENSTLFVIYMVQYTATVYAHMHSTYIANLKTVFRTFGTVTGLSVTLSL